MHLIEDSYFSARELKILLAKYRGRAVPDRTLRFWRNELKIRPLDGNLYDQEDLTKLVRLVKWLGRGGTLKGFHTLLMEEMDREVS